MKEIFVKISDENIELASQILEKLGAEIIEKKTIVRKSKAKKLKNVKQIIVKKKKKSEKVSPTYLFGKWKTLDIDAKKLRKEAWDRSHKFL
jgi:hypothetical protein